MNVPVYAQYICKLDVYIYVCREAHIVLMLFYFPIIKSDIVISRRRPVYTVLNSDARSVFRGPSICRDLRLGELRDSQFNQDLDSPRVCRVSRCRSGELWRPRTPLRTRREDRIAGNMI